MPRADLHKDLSPLLSAASWATCSTAPLPAHVVSGIRAASFRRWQRPRLAGGAVPHAPAPSRVSPASVQVAVSPGLAAPALAALGQVDDMVSETLPVMRGDVAASRCTGPAPLPVRRRLP